MAIVGTVGISFFGEIKQIMYATKSVGLALRALQKTATNVSTAFKNIQTISTAASIGLLLQLCRRVCGIHQQPDLRNI